MRFIETRTMDVKGMVATLRGLPDGAGTAYWRWRRGYSRAARVGSCEIYFSRYCDF